ncbi:hypothetical protein [Paractinoplanes durhamensis]|uniref:hypothetical protein n=1 Tax=Paractinoplanes durhamensis TaxID=113563 RepID=UPI001EF29585|nr:hypothetical protein [Actinoplanes durhamensis]
MITPTRALPELAPLLSLPLLVSLDWSESSHAVMVTVASSPTVMSASSFLRISENSSQVVPDLCGPANVDPVSGSLHHARQGVRRWGEK